MKWAAAALALACACAPAWAINKCTGADGKVVFQDLPCAGRGEAIEVKPASGVAPAAVPAGGAATPAAAKPKAEPRESNEKWLRRYKLEHAIKDARAYLANNDAQCRRKHQELQMRQESANNNLAGATYRQSLAAEMQANATMCETRSRELQGEIERSQKELDEMNASKP